MQLSMYSTVQEWLSRQLEDITREVKHIEANREKALAELKAIEEELLAYGEKEKEYREAADKLKIWK